MQETTDIVLAVHSGAIVLLLGFAAWRDIVIRIIPDTVSILLVVIGAATRLVQGWEPLGTSLLVASAIFIMLLPLCIRGILGGADLKLLAALAVGLSPQASLFLVANVTIVGGALALLYVALAKLLRIVGTTMQPRGRANSLWRRIVNIESWRIRRRSPLPYGIAIAVGAAFAVLNHQGV